MRDSDTYMAIIDEGREIGHVEEIKKMIFRLGQKSCGAPDESSEGAFAAINDLDRLESLYERIPDVKSWQELLATP